MAWLNSVLALTFAAFFIFFAVPASGDWEVAKPYPGHAVAIEGEKFKVKCVIVNFKNDTAHDNITDIWFYKIVNRFGIKDKIVDDGKYSLKNTTDYFNGVPRWNATMEIKNMTLEVEGQYECEVEGNSLARYRFGISFIEKKDVPEIKYSGDKEVDFNEPVTLSCGLLIKKDKKLNVKLISIAWFKGDEKLEEIKNLENEHLKNRTLLMKNPSEAGAYKCQLTALLGNHRDYKITGTITVKVKPMFMTKELEDNEIIKTKGEPATMDCKARGNPITIVWKKQPRSEKQTQTINQTGNLTISSNKYEGFKLEILETDFEDRGDYYCCIRSSNVSVPDQCQRFTLRVKDPLGYLWPLIGIIIEAILIIIILLVAAKFKSKENDTFKSDANTELSYAITNEGSKGSIRLRNTGATAN